MSTDAVERRFWAEVWESAPPELFRERGVELRRFGPVQATMAASLPEVPMLNLLLGAGEPGAVAGGHLAEASEWMRAAGVQHYVPLAPQESGAAEAEAWLSANGYERGYGWMKFSRDAHPPRFSAPAGVEVGELGSGDEAPFGAIVAAGFDLPAWTAAFFTSLPERPGWHCYVASVGGEPQACGAMLVVGEIAHFGLTATLEPARGRGCQTALLRRRIVDAAAAGCTTLVVETGERVPGRPSTSYGNILRAGFQERYVRPNWVLAAES